MAISPRRNKFGKRFRFARFTEVEDGRSLAICLDNILVNGRMIHVNLLRFARPNVGFGGRKVGVVMGEQGRAIRRERKQPQT